MTTVAVMQPYFVPYAGYFRLFEVADIFVVYDCVQFPRRGYVHRNRLPDRQSRAGWLTMPVARASRDASIQHMNIAHDARQRLAADVRRFPSIARHATDPLVRDILEPGDRLAAFLVRSLTTITERLGLSCDIRRSSTLDVPAESKGQDRVLAIVEAVGGTRYVNAPGGRPLYDRAAFAHRGLSLAFLTPFAGEGWSILHELFTEPKAQIAQRIRTQARCED